MARLVGAGQVAHHQRQVDAPQTVGRGGERVRLVLGQAEAVQPVSIISAASPPPAPAKAETWSSELSTGDSLPAAKPAASS